MHTSRGVVKGHEIVVLDRENRLVGTLHYRPDRPLKCGASVWFETDASVTVLQRTTPKHVRVVGPTC